MSCGIEILELTLYVYLSGSKNFSPKNRRPHLIIFSPLNNYIAIGMKVRRSLPSTHRDSPLIEFYKLDEAGQCNRISAMKPVTPGNDLRYRNYQQFVVNAISFIPGCVFYNFDFKNIFY